MTTYLPAEAVEAAARALHARHDADDVFAGDARAAVEAAAPHIAAQATRDVRAERDSILRRIDRLESDESWWVGGAWGDYGEAVIPLRALSTLTGPLADAGPEWETRPEFAAAYGDLRATVEKQTSEIADLRASRDGWASRMMEFAEAQQSLADLRAGIEAVRGAWRVGRCACLTCTETRRHADALDALLRGA